MPDPKVVENIILSNTVKDKQYIDIRGVVKSFNMTIEYVEFEDVTIIGKIIEVVNGDEKKRYLLLLGSMDIKEQNTAIAMLLSKYCLSPHKLSMGGYSLSIFDLKNLKEQRFSRQMYLATRFALPEHMIDRMDDITLSNKSVEATNHFNRDFVFSSIKGHTISFLLENKI